MSGNPADRLTRLPIEDYRYDHGKRCRMGVQEIIWDCRSWWSGADRLDCDSACYDRKGHRRKHLSPTLAHRDHIHIGLNLPGPRERTSFWRR